MKNAESIMVAFLDCCLVEKKNLFTKTIQIYSAYQTGASYLCYWLFITTVQSHMAS